MRSAGALTGPTARDAIRELLRDRADGATICPSEAARLLAGDEWRAAMDTVHAAALALADEGQVRLSQRGEVVAKPSGAYRIGRA